VFSGDALAQVPASTNKAPWPMSGPFIANYTGIGGQTDAGANPNPPAFAAPATKGVQYRRGFAGQVLNSLFVNLGAVACHAVDATADRPPASQTSMAAADLIRFVSRRVIAPLRSRASRSRRPPTATLRVERDPGRNLRQRTTPTSAHGRRLRRPVQENVKFNGKVFGGAAYDPWPAALVRTAESC
jgi:hypothetical protein